MTHIRRSKGWRQIQGFSLIELMVSLTIGLVIVVAAMSAYLGAAGAGKMSEAQSRMNEDAQAALSILTQQIRMAGNNPGQTNRVMDTTPSLSSSHNPVYLPTPTYAGFTLAPTSFTLAAFSIRGCDGKFSNITSTTSTLDTLDASSCVSGTSTLPTDSIAINYEADQFNTLPTDTGNKPTDCLGSGLPTVTATVPTFEVVSPSTTATTSTTAVTYTVAENRFFIGTSTAIVTPSLYCKGNGGGGLNAQQPLVENVEDMQFTYGTMSTTTTSTTATVAGYLRADEVDGLGTTPADAATRWSKVLTVRICILVRSASQVVSDTASAKYYNCAGTLLSPSDRYLRRAYSTTVVLRNRRL